MALAMGLQVVPPLTNHQKKCHTMQSNFSRNSLKAKESGTNKVTHFFAESPLRLGSYQPRLAALLLDSRTRKPGTPISQSAVFSCASRASSASSASAFPTRHRSRPIGEGKSWGETPTRRARRRRREEVQSNISCELF